tara:strand:+ start:382 stop:921 length:540 start_codon:yes stop_codon:yes gene_type:complete
MNLIELDDYVLTTIIKFNSLHEIYYMTLIAPNKHIQKLCKNLLFNYKTNNAIYNKILIHKRSNIEIDNLKLIFFKITKFRNNFKEFRNYIFYIFNNIKENEFGLITRMEKLCYIKKIDDNCALMILYHELNNIYFSFYYKNPLKKLEQELNNENPKNNSGYIYYNNKLIQENEFIIKYI